MRVLLTATVSRLRAENFSTPDTSAYRDTEIARLHGMIRFFPGMEVNLNDIKNQQKARNAPSSTGFGFLELVLYDIKERSGENISSL